MKRSILTSRGLPSHWWAALPILPRSRTAPDPWARQDDGRNTPYERLRRIWFDHTRFHGSKDDPLRSHEFINSGHGVCLTCRFWEFMSLYSPGLWIENLLREVNFPSFESPIDCAWGYEFEALVGNGPSFKQTDIVVHARNEEQEELLVVVEVKRPGDKLKESTSLPDTICSSYLDRESFRTIDRRYLIYLVYDDYVRTVQSKVDPNDDRWRVLGWRQALQLHERLLAESYSREVARFFADTLRVAVQDSGIDLSLPASSSAKLLEMADALVTQQHDERVRDSLLGCRLFLQCLSGSCDKDLPFKYLNDEPSFEDIHLGRAGLPQTTADRRKSLWRLPPV